MSDSAVIAALLSPMPRLSKRRLAMPFSDKESASILYIFVLMPLEEAFPFLSVGPEPAMMRTTGGFCLPSGSVSVPCKSPDAVLRIKSDSPGTGAAAEEEVAEPAAAAADSWKASTTKMRGAFFMLMRFYKSVDMAVKKVKSGLGKRFCGQ